MTVVLVVLAAMWIGVGISWARSRRDQRGVNSISSFSKHLSVLERTGPAVARYGPGTRYSGRPAPIYPAAGYQPPRPAMSLSNARRRRRNVLAALAGAVVGTLVLVPFAGSLMVLLQITTDLLLVAYLVLLARTQRLAMERRQKVRYLPQPAAREPQLLLHRSAN